MANKTKIVVFGASGIVGQLMRLCVPYSEVDPHFFRRDADLFFHGLDLTDRNRRGRLLKELHPNVIVNLAGENRVDEVEGDPDKFADINAAVPGELAHWCDVNGAHLIQVSSQAVFDGKNPPYGPGSPRTSVNVYGWQKIEAEDRVRQHSNWTIARLTFVLGVRPLPCVGRENPVEQMLTLPEQKQVADAWFSPLFAWHAASELWGLVAQRPKKITVHVGLPIRVSRYQVAVKINTEEIDGKFQVKANINPSSVNDFSDLAPRPIDTTWDMDVTSHALDMETGLRLCRQDFANRCHGTRHDLAVDLALFLGIPLGEAFDKLNLGFLHYHKKIAEEFREKMAMVMDGEFELRQFYLNTHGYIWELSAYHTEPDDGYRKMCQGIAGKLKAEGKREVLCLGDGIGTLSIILREFGLVPIYNDLAGSETARFGMFRFWRQFGVLPEHNMSEGWPPDLQGKHYDAIIALDFMEHLPNVEEWARAIFQALKPGGLFLAQNAFGMGSGPSGSIPMHLTRNDRYMKEWDALLDSLGFVRLEGNWRRKRE